MRRLKQLLVLFTLVTAFHAPAQPCSTCYGTNMGEYESCYCTDTGGCGYRQCRSCPYLAPTIALALVAIGLIVAVGVAHSHTSH